MHQIYEKKNVLSFLKLVYQNKRHKYGFHDDSFPGWKKSLLLKFSVPFAPTAQLRQNIANRSD